MRLVLLILAVAVVSGGVSAVAYQRHAAVHLRASPKATRCAVVARRQLKKMPAVSGTEPHEAADGTTVYLTSAEDVAVRCIRDRSKETARNLTTAFAQLEPTERAKALVDVYRKIPSPEVEDVTASIAYLILDGALDALPESAERKAAADELVRLRACRFSVALECPTRPPIPALVWLTGVPSALGILYVLGVAIPTGIAKLGERMRQRKAARAARTAAKAAGSPPSPPKDGGPDASSSSTAAASDSASADDKNDDASPPRVA